MKLVKNPFPMKELKQLAKDGFGNLVKAVVDVDKEIMVIDGELHADEESLLLQAGSMQKHLWGINLYPDLTGKDFIEFDSMINLRPSQHNLSRSVDDKKIREKITSIVMALIKK